MRIRSALVGVASAFVLVTTAAQAADLNGPVTYDEAPEIRRFSWSGIYGGIHAGGAWGDSKLSENLPNLLGILPPSVSSEHGVDGAIGGVHLGINRQFGNIVLGTELRFSGADISGSTGDCFGLTSLINTVAPGAASVGCESSVNWMASAMARLGYAWDRWLVYGNVGWAVAGVDHSSTISVNPALLPLSLSSAVNETADGIAYGGGVEFAISNSVILGVEYTRTELEADGSGLLLGGVLTTGSRDINLDEIKARLSFKFGG
jgi:outer membrane immunogenic protein